MYKFSFTYWHYILIVDSHRDDYCGVYQWCLLYLLADPGELRLRFQNSINWCDKRCTRSFYTIYVLFLYWFFIDILSNKLHLLHVPYYICCTCVSYWNVIIYCLISSYHFPNIATWTVCMYYDVFKNLRNKLFMQIIPCDPLAARGYKSSKFLVFRTVHTFRWNIYGLITVTS